MIVTQAAAKLWKHPLNLPARLPAEALYRTATGQLEGLESLVRRALRHSVQAALAASLAEELTSALVEHAVIERIVDNLLTGDTLEHILAIAVQRGVATRAVDSPLADSAAAALSRSEHVLGLVEAIARSDEVREALQAQSSGFARALAVEMRGRTSRIDDLLERRARAVLRRPQRPAPVVHLPTETRE